MARGSTRSNALQARLIGIAPARAVVHSEAVLAAIGRSASSDIQMLSGPVRAHTFQPVGTKNVIVCF